MMKIFVIIDGIGDKPCRKLNGKTPLEAARTPNLDYFSSKSKAGYVYTVSEKIAPESDIAVAALLGNDPFKVYTGRGPLEAYGAGLDVRAVDLCLRCNFATVNSAFTIMDRRAGRSLTTREAKELAKAINKSVKLDLPFEFVSTIQHRGVVLIRDNKLSSNISNVDPEYKKVGAFGVSIFNKEKKVLLSKAIDSSIESKQSARVVNQFVQQSYCILSSSLINKNRKKKHLMEANIILPRDAGVGLPEFIKHKNWAAVIGMPLEMGIAKCSGMNILKFNYPEMEGNDVYDNLYDGLKETIMASAKAVKAKKFDSYYIHFKETDIPGHDNRPLDKVKMIEMIDSKFFSELRKMNNVEIVVTGDHSTPCEDKRHSADPVPLIWYNKGFKSEVSRFTENECRKGSLGKMYGKDVLRKVGF